MAEALFGVAARLIITISSPAFEKAYKKACSIKNAKKDLKKLEASIETIQAVLLDAEKKQDSSAAVKNWIKRVRDVLYDADDLFDEVATDDMLRKQTNGGSKLMKKVQDSFSSLNPIVSNNSIAKRVKDIRNRLLEISEDMKQFQFVKCLNEIPIGGMRKGQDLGLLFIDSEEVIGRDKDKQAILEMLVAESSTDVSVIAIVGIGGMGKTTLAQLVHNDDETQRNFGENKWFVCISDTSVDKEVIRKIYQSTCGGRYKDLSIIDLQNRIREKMKGRKFLLVLDDVWDDDRGRWQQRMCLLSGGAKGSKVIVTTRSDSVATALSALETHHLDGLLEEESWDLFKSIVHFTPEQENDLTWINIGRKFVRKGANVPLAIRSIASLLAEKNTIKEWELFGKVGLPKLGQNDENEIMPVLRLSYNHLSSNLKPCFAYCSLFPKDHIFDKHVKDDLVHLWASQGYIKTTHDSQNIEDMGHSYFMDLFRRSFFQVYVDYEGQKWKMHDLIHDLAQEVATGESIMLTTSSSEITGARHVSISAEYTIDDTWADSYPLLNVKKLRSFLCQHQDSSSLTLSSLTLDKQFAKLKCLRALKIPYICIEGVPSSIGELKHLRYLDIKFNRIKDLPSSIGRLKQLRYIDISGYQMEVVPSSIGELKHLRYLDISYNKIKRLPDDITKMVNLCTLKISRCRELEALPSQFRKLTNLRSLINEGCERLNYMPLGFEELTSLQCLLEFRVSREIDGVQMSKLDVLSELKLTGELRIRFKDETYDWDRVECWQPPLTLHVLRIEQYKGLRIPHWGNGSTIPNLTTLSLSHCTSIKCLPPLKHLPFLNCIELRLLTQLETIQGEVEEGEEGYDALYVPINLKKLSLYHLPNLVGWWNVAAASACTWLPLPSLYELRIDSCPQLNDMLLCPTLHKLELYSVQLLFGVHDNYSPPNSIQTSSLQSITLFRNHDLVIFPGEPLTSLRHLYIGSCSKLNKVQLAPLGSNILEGLSLWDCPELELWEEKKRGVDWESLTELTTLKLFKVPSSEELPDCLRKRQERGVLQIRRHY